MNSRSECRKLKLLPTYLHFLVNFFYFINNFKFVVVVGFSDSSLSSSASPIRRRRPFSDSSSPSLLRFVAVNDNGGSGGSLFRQ
ncbi:hypothetical protein Q3G72_001501 [Acer saccharum]|nr:hypothetical protein Q3G72_001501 [Acer saccharum]